MTLHDGYAPFGILPELHEYQIFKLIVYQKQKHMKNYILLFALFATLAIWQGCSPKSEESSAKQEAAAQAALVKNQSAKDVEAKRLLIKEASAQKEEQRKLAISQKAKVTPTYKDASGNVVYYKTEVDPTYTGGLEELERYLRDNLKYPTEALKKGHEGTVFVDFVIDTKGKVRDVVASDVVGEDVDISFKEESVRVVAAMTGWKAGLQNGKAVDTSFSIPITFQINN